MSRNNTRIEISLYSGFDPRNFPKREPKPTDVTKKITSRRIECLKHKKDKVQSLAKKARDGDLKAIENLKKYHKKWLEKHGCNHTTMNKWISESSHGYNPFSGSNEGSNSGDGSNSGNDPNSGFSSENNINSNFENLNLEDNNNNNSYFQGKVSDLIKLGLELYNSPERLQSILGSIYENIRPSIGCINQLIEYIVPLLESIQKLISLIHL